MQKNVPLSSLAEWEGNPRGMPEAEAIAEMAASLATHGQLQNLVVRPMPKSEASKYPGATWQVIAGATRLMGLRKLADAGQIPGTHPVAVNAMKDLSDGAAIAIALAENVIRREMDVISQYETFARMVEEGLDEREIGQAFNISEHTVRGRLVLAKLVPAAKDLVRRRQRGVKWAEAMTLASPEAQQQICDQIAIDNESWARDWEVRRHLTAKLIPLRHAAFPLEDYQDNIVRDLFDTINGPDAGFFANREAFWRLQNAAVDRIAAELAAEGWARVDIERSGNFDVHMHQRTDTKSLAFAVVDVTLDGAVTIHRGLYDPSLEVAVTTDDDAQGEDPSLLFGASTSSDGGVGAIFGSTETGDVAFDLSDLDPANSAPPAAVAAHAAAVRTAAVQVALQNDGRLAKAVAIVALMGHPELGVRAPDYTIPVPVTDRTGAAFDASAENRRQMQDLLESSGAGKAETYRTKLLMALLRMSDEHLDQVFRTTVAGKIGQQATRKEDADPNSLINQIGAASGIRLRDTWTPDETYLEHLKGNQLRGLAEAMLPNVDSGQLNGTPKRQLVEMLASSFAMAAAGNGGRLPADVIARLNAWVPRGFSFAHETSLAASDGDSSSEAEMPEWAREAIAEINNTDGQTQDVGLAA